MKRRDTGQLRAQPRSGLGCSCLSGDSRDYQPAHPDPAKDQPGAPPAERKALLHLDDRLQMNEADSAKVAACSRRSATSQRPPSTRPTRRAELLRRAPGRRGQGDGEAQQLVRLKRDKPDVPVVLTGCMVTIAAGEAEGDLPSRRPVLRSVRLRQARAGRAGALRAGGRPPAAAALLPAAAGAGRGGGDGLHPDHLRLQLPLLLLHRALPARQGNHRPLEEIVREVERGRRDGRPRGDPPRPDGQRVGHDLPRATISPSCCARSTPCRGWIDCVTSPRTRST